MELITGPGRGTPGEGHWARDTGRRTLGEGRPGKAQEHKNLHEDRGDDRFAEGHVGFGDGGDEGEAARTQGLASVQLLATGPEALSRLRQKFLASSAAWLGPWGQCGSRRPCLATFWGIAARVGMGGCSHGRAFTAEP